MAATSVAVFKLLFVVLGLHLEMGTAILEGQCNDMHKETIGRLVGCERPCGHASVRNRCCGTPCDAEGAASGFATAMVAAS